MRLVFCAVACLVTRAFAQQPSGGARQVTPQAVSSAIVWVGVLIGLVMLAGGLLMVMRKRLGREEAPASTGIFEQMRQLHREGKLSDEEFARVRSRMSASMLADLDAGSRDSGPDDSNVR